MRLFICNTANTASIDSGKPQSSRASHITVIVINDNTPMFSTSVCHVSISGNLPSVTKFLPMSTADLHTVHSPVLYIL